VGSPLPRQPVFWKAPSQLEAMTATATLPRAGAALRRAALSYPEAREEMPWGHHAIKVKGKTFLFLGADSDTFSLSAKLPSSGGVALNLPFAEPTHYGLGKSGWVTATFPRKSAVPLELLKLWIDESYRAIAPKRLVAELDAGAVTRRSRGRVSLSFRA
jgi:predicted DNA-binding protein (MmcQ/YjbR family)